MSGPDAHRPAPRLSGAWIGTSGWSYDHWAGAHYPEGTRPIGRPALYTHEFPTVELDASFYRWPRDATFLSWRRRLPEGSASRSRRPEA